MRTLRLVPLLVALALLALPHGAVAQDTTSVRLTQRVTDVSGVLSSTDRESIATELKQYEDSTGNQFVVLVIPTLNGEPIESYAVRNFRSNGIGQRGRNNGLLMVVALAERKIRIEVGYGLEGALPDVLTAQIREREITPRFKTGEYAEGIRQGLRALMAAAAGEYKATESTSANSEGEGMPWLFYLLVFGPFVLVGTIIFFTIRSARKRGKGWSSGSTYVDNTTQSAGWFSSSSDSSSSWSSSDSSSSGSDNSFSGGGGDSGGGGSTGDW